MEREYHCETKEEPIFYRIGLFSRMNQVTIKTLRHYDEIGLLKPEYTDQENGYRYYSSSQLPILYKILSLRDMGFSLEEIGTILNGASEQELLQYKKSQLLRQLAEITMQISQVESYLSGFDPTSDYHVIVKSIPSHIVASRREVIKNYACLTDFILPMGEEMIRLGCECEKPDYCYTTYYDDEYREENLDVEVCQAVVEAKEDTALVHFKTIPAIERAACVLHRGSYDDFPKAYHALFKWISRNGYEILDHSRECYIDGAWNKENQQEWLTELQVPVRKLPATKRMK